MGGCCSFTLLGLKAFTESLEHREVVDGGTVTEPFAPSRGERWSRIFAQGVKWNFCLTAGTIQGLRIRRDHEEESTPEPLTGLQS